MSAEQILHDEEAEAQAFTRRIEERVEAGFVPDLRRAVKCEYFYKSFWRDPQFIKLYVGEIVNTYLRMLGHYGGAGLRILDVGCGAGYVSLELARAGHQVIAIDIAGSCIEIARETLAQNPFKDGFGSLEYHVMPFHQASGVYDVILFSGSLHHFDDPDEDVRKGCELLVPGGLILCHEPCHEKWRMEDAAQVALIRTLLSLTGHWYEPFIDTEIYRSYGQFEAYVGDIHTEYVTEQDKQETAGQSPNDNSSTAQEILLALRRHLVELECTPAFSFIYRLLGGLRGPEPVVSALADFLTLSDRVALKKGYMRPNSFFFIGRRAAPTSPMVA
jgi:2-polyprenyl-3-methyl-5-hydroxy-6-metoxy-1,4-benzoquinol methylase